MSVWKIATLSPDHVISKRSEKAREHGNGRETDAFATAAGLRQSDFAWENASAPLSLIFSGQKLSKRAQLRKKASLGGA